MVLWLLSLIAISAFIIYYYFPENEYIITMRNTINRIIDKITYHIYSYFPHSISHSHVLQNSLHQDNNSTMNVMWW
jgi:hypothetical protein